MFGYVTDVAKGAFSGARQRHTARLLDLVGPMGLTEIMEIVGGERRALDRSLQSLETQGLLQAVEVPGGSAPGRAARLWSLTEEGRAAVPRPDAREVGRLVPGMTWVAVQTDGDGARRVEDRLGDGAQIAAAAWVTRVDGDGRTYVVAFPPDASPAAPQMLERVLGDVGRCTSGTVRASQSPFDFVDALRRAEAAARRYAE